MYHNTDYQRYKQKMDRLQSKIKKSESARKELEIKFQRLLKERNECERSAQDHKSKYDKLLKHETQRLNRNEELLHMLEDVHTKASRMASNTERLKKMKMQQEFIVMNNLKRNSYLQQHFMHPKAILSNSMLGLPAARSIQLYEHQSPMQVVNAMPMESVRSSTHPQLISATPAYYTELPPPRPVYQQSDGDKTMAAPAVAQSTVTGIHAPVLYEPIYLNDANTHFVKDLRHLHDSTLPMRYLSAQHLAQQPVQLNNSQTVPFDNIIHLKDLSRNDHQRHEPVPFYANQSKIDFTNSELPSSDKANYGKYFAFIPPADGNAPTVHQPQKTIDDSLNSAVGDLQYNNSKLNFPTSQTMQQNQFRYVGDSQPGSFSVNNTPTATNIDLNSLPKENSSFNFTANEQTSYDKLKELPNFNTNVKDNSISTPRVAPNLYERKNSAEYKYDRDIGNITTDPLSYSRDERANVPVPVSSSVPVYADVMKSLESPILSNVQNSNEFSPQKYTSNNINSAKLSDSTEIRKEIDYTNNNYYRETVTKSPETKPKIPFANEATDYSTQSPDSKRRSSMDSVPIENSDESELHKMSINAHRRYSEAVNSFTRHQITTPTESNQIASFATNNNEQRRRESIESNRQETPNSNIESLAQVPISTFSENQPNSFHSNVEFQPNPEITDDTGYNQLQTTLNENYHENLDANDVGQTESEIYIGDASAPYTTYAMDDQTGVETAMENLSLGNFTEQDSVNEPQVQTFDNEMDRSRAIHGKTVTWADDLDNNYKKFETSQGFEKQDTEIIEDTGAFYGDENQQQQSEYSASEYLDDGGGGGGDGDGSGGVGNDIIESSNTQNQYDENQYQAQVVDETNQNVYNNEYYYPDQQLNQYEQYEAQQKQEEPQQYYANDVTEENQNASNYLSEGYQQYETPLQAQPQADEYYTVQPGENYYAEYEEANDQSTNFSINTNENPHNMVSSNAPILEQQQLEPNIDNLRGSEHTMNTHIPNYLHSDTDDSQTGYQSIPNNNLQPNQDSDFDFSTNSEMN